MPTTTPTSRNGFPRFTTRIPTSRSFLRCVACGTIKKERTYALCSECFRLNGTLDRSLFTCFARHAERESQAYSYRTHPEFAKACRIYARRDRKARALATIDARVPKNWRPHVDPRDRHEDEPYDGLGPHDLGDLLDWQMNRAELPEAERSGHRELSDAEIAHRDARVDAWARARGATLKDEPTPRAPPLGLLDGYRRREGVD